VDGDQTEEHKWYRYGGMWKNKHEAVSAKMPKGRSKKVASQERSLEQGHSHDEEGGAEMIAEG